MKKLSELPIADLNALYNHIDRKLTIATSQHNGKYCTILLMRLDAITSELDKRVSEIDDFKDI